jgi:hypothetical protein
MGGAQFGILDGRGRQSQRERHENEKPFREERHGAYCRELRSVRETGRTANTPRHSASLAPHWCGPRGWSQCAADCLRALEAWRAWISQWRRTGDPRALRTAQACEQIAREKLVIRRPSLHCSCAYKLGPRERCRRHPGKRHPSIDRQFARQFQRTPDHEQCQHQKWRRQQCG